MKKKLAVILALCVMITSTFPLMAFADITYPGWNEENTIYYTEEGVYVTGITEVDGVLYYFSDEGVKQLDAYAEKDSLLYYFDSEGKGSKFTGTYNGSEYVDGVKQETPEKTYEPSKLVKAEDGKWHYSNAEGKLYVPSSAGVKKMDNGKRYYFYADGHVYKNTAGKSKIVKIDGKAYYFNSSSSVKTNGTTHNMTIDGKTYRVSSHGYLLTGFRTVNGNKYYFSKTSYAKVKDKVLTVGDDKYWLSKSGKVKTNVWKKDKNGFKKNYFGKNGKMLKDTSKYIGKYKYYFNKKGTLVTDLIAYKGYDWVASHSLKVMVNRTHNVVYIYAKDGDKGYTIPVIAMLCTVGTASRPTDPGTFRTGATYRWKDLGGRTEYQDNGDIVYGQYVTHFNGAMYFHSVCYTVNGNNHTLLTGAYNWLGNAGSHGCVRLQCGNAYKMYNLANRQRMTVVVYNSNYKGPFGKPLLKKIGTSYDPTDPNIK